MGLKERLKGREGWRSLNKTFIVVIYTILIVGALAFQQNMWIMLTTLLVLAIAIPIYVAFFINHLRNMEKKKKGNEVFGGWFEHRHGKGELKYFMPEEILPYTRLSEIDQASVDDFLEYIEKKTKEQIKISLKAKETKEPPKLLTYEEKEEKEQEELDDLKEEFEEIYEEEYDLEETLNEGDLRELYEKGTGKNAEWRGNLTKGYLEWKKEKLGECEDV